MPKKYTWKSITKLMERRYNLYNKHVFFFLTECGPETVEGFEYDNIDFYSNGNICFTVDDYVYTNTVSMKVMYCLVNKLIELEKEI